MDYLIVYWEILLLTFIFTIIMFFSVRHEMGSDREVTIFKALLMTLMLALVVDGFTHGQYRGFFHMPVPLVAFLYATYMSLVSGMLPSLWFIFADMRMGFTFIKNKKLFYAILSPAIIVTIMCYISIWTGWMFSVDSEGIYSRGPLWAFQNLVGYCYLLFTTVHALIRARKEPFANQRKQYYTLAMFIISPFLGALLQLLIGSHPFVAPACSIGMLFIFINIQNNMINQDSLTGLMNRRSIEQHIEALKLRMIDREESFYLYVMDIDDFKKINDTFGHIEGDRALRIVASLLQKTVDEYDGFIGRLGGDEFIALIKSNRIDNPKDFEESFKKAVEGESNLLRLPYAIRLSFGYIRCESGNSDTTFLISQADKEMYANKNARRVEQLAY